ncbi:ATP-binding protein, partial [Pseudomonas donghuensis]|nr:ATP-binding protein [Pseudomonas donghuensis]
VWQQQQLTSYCLYGSKRNMMLNIFNNSNSPFYRFGQVIFMQKIAKEHWIPFILSSFEKTGKSISAEMAERICDAVACHSWYLQQ